MKKRILSALLAISMVMALIPTFGINVFAAGGLTRAEWITQLVAAFEMTVEDDSNMPDNYFSDISEDDSYYRDILLAVEFGVIDLEAGEAFDPNESATREFAAQTLNACLQFQLDEGAAYTFNESASVTYPDDIQVAVNQGWFTLSSGNFLPSQAVTSAEATAMLNKAKTIIANEAIDENYNSQYEFANGVIVVPETVETVIEGEIVTIADYDGNISGGDIFVVYTNGIPVPFKAISITKNGTSTVVTTTKDGTEEAITSADSEGSIDIDLENFEVNELTTFSVTDTSKPNAEAEEMQIELYSINYDKKSKKLTASQSIKLGGSSVGTVSIDLTNMKLDHKIDTKRGEYEAIINANSKITTSLSFDLGDYAGIPSSLTLGYVPIEGIGSIALEMEYSIKGGITMAWTGDLKAGVAYARNSGFRLVKEYTKKDFSYTANLDLKVGLRLSAGFDVGVLSANVWATVGVKMSAKIQGYDSGTPKTCVTISGYLYANVGASATINYVVDKKTFSKQVDIYTESNSPVRVVNHYEDNVLVGSCARGQEIKYHTSSTSKYFNPYSSNAKSSYGGSGTGISDEPIVIWEYTITDNKATITAYHGNASAVKIPSTIDGYKVTAISSSAFQNNTYIKALSMPNSIVTVASKAFSGCTSLSSVVLSDSITQINNRVFYNCTSLSDINLSNNITSIERYAFYNCTSLSDVVLPKNLTNMDSMAFMNCTALTSINIPRKLDSCGFYTYDGLFPQYGGPFIGCDNLCTIEFEKGVTKIPRALFYNCSGITEINVPETVTSIGMYAFSCANLKKVTGMKYVTTIGNFAFQGDTKLTEIELPSRLQSIGAGAFRNCTSLKKVIIPKTLTYVGYDYSVVGIGVGNAGVFAGNTIKEIYFEDGCTDVPSNLCISATGLEHIHFSNSIEDIGEHAFSGCSSLQEIKLGAGIKYIDDYAFSNCVAANKFEANYCLQTIGEGAFNDCESIKEIELPNTVTDIYNYAFWNCKELEKFSIPTGISYLSSGMFQSCEKLNNVVIPNNITAINGSCFRLCKSLTNIEIPYSVVYIGTQAFDSCIELKSITIPDSVRSIGTSCFNNCESLVNVTMGLGIQEIPNSAFKSCSSLEEIVVPRFCTTISSNAFQEDVLLEKVTLSDNMTSIADNAFSYPSRITIRGHRGTYAEEFANSDEYTFEPINISTDKLNFYIDRLVFSRLGNQKALPLNITPLNSNDIIIFKSSNENVAEVVNGIVTATGYGSAKITATTSSGKSSSIDIEVVNAATSVSLEPTLLRIERGTKSKIEATKYPINANDELVWNSSNSDVAEVDQKGNVTAKKKGTAIITVKASYSGVSATCTVTVYSNEIDVEGIALSRNSGEVVIGTDYPLTATILPENATNKNIVWTSTDETVATVSNGVITALSTGTTTITATTADGGFTAECEITVIPKTEIVSFTVEETDKFVTHLTASNVPDTAVIYIAAYDVDNRLVGIQTATLDNGTADTEFNVPDAVDFKAFVWYENMLLPLVECEQTSK